MTLQLDEPVLDSIFAELEYIVHKYEDIKKEDLDLIRVLLYNDRARDAGLLKSEIIDIMVQDGDYNLPIYRVGKAIRRLVAHNIIGEMPNLLDMRMNKYYLVCLKKYRRK